MGITLLLPGSLADLAGEPRVLELRRGGGTLRDVLDALAVDHPVLEHRIRDEAGALRRHVNVYVDGQDVRAAGGIGARVPAGAHVQVLASVAGG